MKIAHLADIHIGPYPGPFPMSRFEDIKKILDWTAEKLIEEEVDLCLIAGDLFKDSKVMLDRASQEIAVIVKFLRQLSRAGIETVVISGTPSHDAVAAYELIREMWIPKTTIITSPLITAFNEVRIACLPGLNRSGLLTQDEMKGLPVEQIHRIMTDKITQLCMGMSAQMPDDKPKILMAHMTYQDADTGFSDLLMQHEPILTREAVEGFDLVCLGHIHRPQIIHDKVFYSGPIERLSFNEEAITPGFLIHELGKPGERFISPKAVTFSKVDIGEKMGDFPVKSMSSVEANLDIRRWRHEFIETPARRYLTLDYNENQIKDTVLYSDHPSFWFGSKVQDTIIRLHYSCSEETAKQLNKKQLEQALYDAGVFFVAEIKADIAKTDRARDSEVTESLTPLEALEKWAINQGIGDIDALKAMTAELLEV